jgi:O-acetylhomoserine/O-acetylserine sulfhydrylase-like pyridoxal-dependent enzyme
MLWRKAVSDKIAGLVVTFKTPISKEDSERFIQAISLMSHVAGVSEVVSDINTLIANARAKRLLVEKLYGVIAEIQN